MSDDRLSVGVETGCVAPLKLERMQMRLSQALGVDSLFLPDHYVGFVPRSVWGPDMTPAARLIPTPDAFFDPYVMMGMMSVLFRGVRIGTGVTEPLRRHPATLAQAFVTLDHLTGGRSICGIGNGERENTEPYGIPFVKRVGRLEEALKIMRLLWESRGEPVDFDGSFWRLKRALFATPLHEGTAPTVWVAAHAPRMLGLTGRYADGWYPTRKMTPQEYRASLDTILAAGRAAGRDMSEFEPATQIQLVLGSSRKAALDELLKIPATAPMAMLIPGFVWAKHGLRHPLGESFEGFPDFVPEEVTAEQMESARRQVTPELLAEGVVAGNVGEVLAEVRALADAGLRHVVMWNLTPLARPMGAADLLRLAVLIRRLRRVRVGG